MRTISSLTLQSRSQRRKKLSLQVTTVEEPWQRKKWEAFPCGHPALKRVHFWANFLATLFEMLRHECGLCRKPWTIQKDSTTHCLSGQILHTHWDRMLSLRAWVSMFSTRLLPFSLKAALPSRFSSLCELGERSGGVTGLSNQVWVIPCWLRSCVLTLPAALWFAGVFYM